VPPISIVPFAIIRSPTLSDVRTDAESVISHSYVSEPESIRSNVRFETGLLLPSLEIDASK
jgi:hypothetical protein